MANPEHLAILQQGVEAWNRWRRAQPYSFVPDLCELSPESDLVGVNFSGTDLVRANLRGLDLSKANLDGADLTEADLGEAILVRANFSSANLAGAILEHTDLTNAVLRNARLYQAFLVSTNLKKADLTGSHIYGISAWDVNLQEAIQKDLVITPPGHSKVSVDQLEVAQFIYLITNNVKIPHVIDTITSKVVLILGRFTDERKLVLDGLREELRKRDYVPVLFDFDKPESRTTVDTVTFLARMAKFVIADLTEPRSIPQELQAIVEQLPSVVVQPILLEGQKPWGMFDHIRLSSSVLPIVFYRTKDELLDSLGAKVINPAEAKLRKIKRRLRPHSV